MSMRNIVVYKKNCDSRKPKKPERSLTFNVDHVLLRGWYCQTSKRFLGYVAEHIRSSLSFKLWPNSVEVGHCYSLFGINATVPKVWCLSRKEFSHPIKWTISSLPTEVKVAWPVILRFQIINDRPLSLQFYCAMFDVY